MKILVDADAFPGALHKVLFRAVERVKIQLILVANRFVTHPESQYISSITVAAGPDVADDRIVELACKGDLVITADIPLADRVITKEAHALNPRGNLYTEDNIKQQLAVRNLMDEMRSAGMVTGGPAAFNPQDVKAFANNLDRLLTKYHRASPCT